MTLPPVQNDTTHSVKMTPKVDTVELNTLSSGKYKNETTTTFLFKEGDREYERVVINTNQDHKNA